MTTSAAATGLTTLILETLGAHEVTGLQRLSGGASRETWRFAADGRELVLQRQRASDERDMLGEAAVVRAAHAAGVPVPLLVDARRRDDGAAFMILEAVEGETIARKILRDERFERARPAIVGQLGTAAAKIHALDPAGLAHLETIDQVAAYTEALDELGRPHPVLELVRRWLLDHRPPPRPPAVVHGDYRLGNVIVDEDGLRAVIDWELAHLGDPMEDLGWLCVKAWRFGSDPPVAGLGAREDLFAAYEEASGQQIDPDVVRWWEVLGTWKWGVMCILQANAHLTGAARSHELAAIGRRVCENEYDLFLALEGRW